MKRFLLASAAVIAFASPAAANDVARELVDSFLPAVTDAMDEVGDLYANGQGFYGNFQTAVVDTRLGDMKRYWDSNQGKWVYGSVTAANIGNSISIEDKTPAPMTYENTTTTTVTESGKVFAKGIALTDGLDIDGYAQTDGLDVDSYVHLPIVGTVEIDGEVDGNTWIDGEVDGNAPVFVKGHWYGTETTEVTETVREFVKGDLYVNAQSAMGNVQYAELYVNACKECAGYKPELENVSMTAANILNSVNIEDGSSRFRGEEGDLYATVQYASGNAQVAVASGKFSEMVGGAITAANIGNSINITDACGVCE